MLKKLLILMIVISLMCSAFAVSNNSAYYLSDNIHKLKMINPKYGIEYEVDKKNILQDLKKNINNLTKLSPILFEEIPYWSRDGNDLYLRVMYKKNISNLTNKYHFEIISSSSRLNIITIKIKEQHFERFANLDEIEYIEEIQAPSENKIANAKQVINVNTLYTTPYDLRGEGINIMQYEVGIPHSHIDYKSRASTPQFHFFHDEHATHVAGILVGDGSVEDKYSGIAPLANLVSYENNYYALEKMFNNTNHIEFNYDNAIDYYDIDIISNSWGIASSNFNCKYLSSYNLDSSLIDSYELPIIWAAGNERMSNYCLRDYFTILPKASAKNVISVGAVNSKDLSLTSFTSYGPTRDGRLKPEIVAPGCFDNKKGIISTDKNNNYSSFVSTIFGDFETCGTSFSAPQVSGVVALMIQEWNKVYSTKILPSTIKAILVDSAKDIDSNGPDYRTGYGLLDAREAIDRIKEGIIIEDEVYFLENTYYVNLSSKQDFKVSLAWSDLPAKPYSSKQLVNDLDLVLISPSNKSYYPYVLDSSNPEALANRGEEHLNNLEQVYLNSSEIEDGEWKIIVKAHDLISSQKYSLVYEKPLVGEFDFLNDPHLVAYYPFDGDFKDYSGNGLHGIGFGGVGFTNDSISGMALELDGIDDYVRIEDNTSFHVKNFTLIIYLKYNETSNQNENKYIFFKDIINNYPSNFHLRVDRFNKLNIQLQNGHQQKNLIYNYSKDWAEIIFSSDGTYNKFYINKKLVSIKRINWSLINNNYPISIGSWFNKDNFKGKIDEIKILNKTLNLKEIKQIYIKQK